MTLDEMPASMKELIKLLPPAGGDWPADDRVRWLQAFEATSRLIFKDDVELKIRAAPTR